MKTKQTKRGASSRSRLGASNDSAKFWLRITVETPTSRLEMDTRIGKVPHIIEKAWAAIDGARMEALLISPNVGDQR